MERKLLEKKLHDLIREYYSGIEHKFVPGKTKVGVGSAIYDEKEVSHVLDSLLSNWISQGKNVRVFEKEFASYHGVREGISLNSGSSANLIALLSLIESGDVKRGSEVIVPATTFPTTVSPVIQLGLKPVFVDVDKETYNIEPHAVKDSITKDTSTLIPAHFLGHPADMDELLAIASDNNLKIMEDCAEAHGAEYKNKKAGSFGCISTFSFFVAHNMTTGEGGMIITDNNQYANLARSLKAFGRACNCPTCTLSRGKPCSLRMNFDDKILKNYDRRQIFLYLGYSMKMSEMIASFGIEQLKKLDKFNEERQDNARYYLGKLRKYEDTIQLPVEKGNISHVYYGFPIVIRQDALFSRISFIKYLEERNIETRPFFGGNLTDQPAFRDKDIKVTGNLPVAKWLRDNGLFIGCHPGIKKEERKYVAGVIAEFLDNLKTRRGVS